MNSHYSNPGELQKYLSTFDYKMGKDYKFQSPRDFEKNKSGICWDYAEYEAWAFNTHFTTFKMTTGKLRNNTYSLYFTQHKGHDGSKEYPTHTWLAYMEDDTVYVVEASWSANAGLHKYKSEQDMIDAYIKKHNKHNDPYILAKYPMIKKYGLTPEEYLNRMYQICTTIHDDRIFSEAFQIRATDADLSEQDKQVKDWRLNSNIILLYSKYKRLNGLEMDYNRFLKMPYSQQEDSDDISIRIFGKKNKERYEDMRHQFYSAEVIKDYVEYDPRFYNIDPIDRVFLMRHLIDDKMFLQRIDRKEFLCNLQEDASDFDLDYHTDIIKEDLESEYRSENIFTNYNCQCPMFRSEDAKILYLNSNGEPKYGKTDVISYDFWQKWNEYISGKNMSSYATKYGNSYMDMILDLKKKGDKQGQIELGWSPEISITLDKLAKIQQGTYKYMSQIIDHVHIINVMDYMKSLSGSEQNISPEYNSPDSYFLFCELDRDNQYIIRLYLVPTINETKNAIEIGIDQNNKVYTFNKRMDILPESTKFIVFEIPKYDILKGVTQDTLYNTGFAKIDINNIGALKLYLNAIIVELYRKYKIDIPIHLFLYKIYIGGFREFFSLNNRYKYFRYYLDKKMMKIPFKSTILEAVMTNEFPVEFNKDGDLLISKGRRINFEGEYSRTHLALKMYEKNKNTTGMKYCICKLWYMNILLEEKIHDRKTKPTEIRTLNKARSKILNDINKYSEIVLKEEPDFDIIKTYQDSPFNNDKIKFSNYTLGHAYDWIKKLLTFKTNL